MDVFKLERAMKTLTLIVDTREQETESLQKRLADAGLPYKRKKLDFGDYSAEVTLDTGETISLANRVVVERKMNIDELAMCYTSQRDRFEREFERAKAAGAKIYLLVENLDFAKLLRGDYRSQMHPNALLASLFAFLARYNCQAIPCSPKTTGRLIREIMKREAKEWLNTVFVTEEEDTNEIDEKENDRDSLRTV